MHEPNSQILLAEMPVRFTSNGKSLEVQAQFILRFLPKPSLVIELDDLPANTKIEFENTFLYFIGKWKRNRIILHFEEYSDFEKQFRK